MRAQQKPKPHARRYTSPCLGKLSPSLPAGGIQYPLYTPAHTSASTLSTPGRTCRASLVLRRVVVVQLQHALRLHACQVG